MAGASIHATSHSICRRHSGFKHGTFPALCLKPFVAYDVRWWRFGSCVVGGKEEICALARHNMVGIVSSLRSRTSRSSILEMLVVIDVSRDLRHF